MLDAATDDARPMNIEPFKAEHLLEIELQAAQQKARDWLCLERARLAEGPNAYTAKVDGRVIVCAGVVQGMQGQGVAWAFISHDAGKHMLAITRAVKRYLVVCPYERVEAVVDEGFDAGHRWLESLGFELETPKPMRKSRPDGGSSYLYARIK